jgi:hypothetical protein
MTDTNAAPTPNPAAPTGLVPDHELLGAIGKGSYGKVWMARSATGALRAVQIVRRCFFETARPYNRDTGRSLFTVPNAAKASSRSAREWAAEIWVRMRALPCGTTGYEKPIT